MQCSCGGSTRSKTQLHAGEVIAKYEECEACRRVHVTWTKAIEAQSSVERDSPASPVGSQAPRVGIPNAPRPDFEELERDPSAFIAIDVETANRRRSSICQIGLVVVSAGQIIWSLEALIDPEQSFDTKHTEIHGIDAHTVAKCITFPEFLQRHADLFEANIPVFSHSRFDEQAFQQACEQYDIRLPPKRWGDTLAIAQCHWAGLSGGHRLENLMHHLRYDFNHHNALADATAAAEVLLTVLRETSKGIDHWLTTKPKTQAGKRSPASPTIQLDPLPGVLAGEVVLFTGELSLTRDRYKELATLAGASIVGQYSQRVTLVVKGHQDPSRTRGRNGMSRTEQRVEEALMSGRSITCLDEAGFRGLLEGTVVMSHG